MIPAIDAATLVRLDAAVPRYTSYPTVPNWSPALPPGALERGLREMKEPTSVYVHVPFCREQCWFCGCNMVVAGNPAAGDRYLDLLALQIERLPLTGRPSVARVHLGGGTPTWLSIPQLERLFRLLDSRFDRPGAEVSVEIDPDVTSDDHLAALLALGLTRISIGVQSVDDRVLRAINRPQDPARIEALLSSSRARGLRNLNFDLVYGLPYQDLDSLDATLAEVERLRPDRVALYSFAHVPWAKAHQLKIPTEALPGPLEKAALYLHGFERLTSAGYEPIGMDHFALPDDELAVAAANGTLHRNFMGYTTRSDLGIVGLGVSAITELDGLYAQQIGKLGAWYRAMREGGDGVERGCTLCADDRRRRNVISSLMCNLHIGAEALRDFPDALPGLQAFADQGLGTLSASGFTLSAAGRFAMRQVAAIFDAFVADNAFRYSRAV